jgi:hypothetical protein
MSDYNEYSNALAAAEGAVQDIQRLRAEGKTPDVELERALFRARLHLIDIHKSYMQTYPERNTSKHTIRTMIPGGTEKISFE